MTTVAISTITVLVPVVVRVRVASLTRILVDEPAMYVLLYLRRCHCDVMVTGTRYCQSLSCSDYNTIPVPVIDFLGSFCVRAGNCCCGCCYHVSQPVTADACAMARAASTVALSSCTAAAVHVAHWFILLFQYLCWSGLVLLYMLLRAGVPTGMQTRAEALYVGPSFGLSFVYPCFSPLRPRSVQKLLRLPYVSTLVCSL